MLFDIWAPFVAQMEAIGLHAMNALNAKPGAGS